MLCSTCVNPPSFSSKFEGEKLKINLNVRRSIIYAKSMECKCLPLNLIATRRGSGATIKFACLNIEHDTAVIIREMFSRCVINN